MKLFLTYPTEIKQFYTPKLLQYLFQKNNILVNSVDEADFLAVSIPTLFHIEYVINLRKKYKNKKILVGGHFSTANPYPLLPFVDYINCGEVFEFLKDKDFSKKYILSKENKNVEASEYIDWLSCPIIQKSKGSYLFWYSVGCRYKCNFCMPSWCHKFQINKIDFKRIIEKVGEKKVNLVSNEYLDSIPYKKFNYVDLLIKNYIKKPKKYQLIRVGLESVREDIRFFYNKNITDDELLEFLNIIDKYKQNTRIFIIQFCETMNDWYRFIEMLKPSITKNYLVALIINYLSPSAGTPLSFLDMKCIREVDFQKISYDIKRKNANFRLVNNNIKYVNEGIHTLVERTNEDNIEKVLQVRKKVLNREIKTKEEFFEECYKIGLKDEVEGDKNVKLVKTSYTDLMLKRKEKLKQEFETLKRKIGIC